MLQFLFVSIFLLCHVSSYTFQLITSRQQRYDLQRNNNIDTRLYDHVQDNVAINITTTLPAPVYITVGPPCGGKTEALRAFLLTEGYNPDQVFSHDVAKLDEQSSVYHRIPLAAFLFPSQHLDPTIGEQILKSGATVKDRLLDPSFETTDEEIRNVMLRIAGRVTSEAFQERTLALVEQARDTVKFYKTRRLAIAQDLVAAVEQVAIQAVSEVICQMQLPEPVLLEEDENNNDDELPYEKEFDKVNTTITSTSAHLLSAKSLIKTQHVDVFVPEALYDGGITKAQEQFQELMETSTTEPVSWGNTNTRPLEYATALQAAQSTGRPVKFVAWGTPRFPKVSRQELLRRNVARLRNSGRYIPSGAIGAALSRVQSLMKDAQQQLEMVAEPCPDGYPPEEWELHKMDVALAALAGFRMDQDGFVVQVDEPKYFNNDKGQKKKKLAASSSGRRYKSNKKKIAW